MIIIFRVDIQSCLGCSFRGNWTKRRVIFLIINSFFRILKFLRNELQAIALAKNWMHLLFFLLRKLWICLWIKIRRQLNSLGNIESVCTSHVDCPLNGIAYDLELVLAGWMIGEWCRIVWSIYLFSLLTNYPFVGVVARWLVGRGTLSVVAQEVWVYWFWFLLLTYCVAQPVVYCLRK